MQITLTTLVELINIHTAVLWGLIFCAVLLLTSRNSIHSVLYLILCFFHAALILFIFNVEFLGLVFIIIYVGALAVLFLFVIMMLDVKNYVYSNIISEFLVPFSLFLIIYNVNRNIFLDTDISFFYFYSFFDSLSGINVLGQLLYSVFVFDVLIAGFILLTAIIGPVILTLTFTHNPFITDYYRRLNPKTIIPSVNFNK